jgi:hypothetical protein
MSSAGLKRVYEMQTESLWAKRGGSEEEAANMFIETS